MLQGLVLGCLHFGKVKQGRTWIVNIRTLESIVEQRGKAKVHSSLKVAALVDKLAKKVYSMFVFIKGWDVMLQLYRMLVRVHLDACVQFFAVSWKNVIKLNRVLKSLSNLSYKERINRLRLFALN